MQQTTIKLTQQQKTTVTQIRLIEENEPRTRTTNRTTIRAD